MPYPLGPVSLNAPSTSTVETPVFFFSNENVSADFPVLVSSSLPTELMEHYERIKSIESKMGIQMRLPYELVVRF